MAKTEDIVLDKTFIEKVRLAHVFTNAMLLHVMDQGAHRYSRHLGE